MANIGKSSEVEVTVTSTATSLRGSGVSQASFVSILVKLSNL